jgi:hypothetical protein
MYYFVRFIGHIDETRRPVGFPTEIYADFTWQVENEQELRYNINEMSKVFVGQHCLIVPRDADEIQVMGLPKFDSRILVPIHMVTHISTETKKIIGEMPIANLDGTSQLIDGTKVRPN